MIIDKYEDNPQSVNQEKLLPILSNQKMNAYLKEIATVCNIEKKSYICSDKSIGNK